MALLALSFEDAIGNQHQTVPIADLKVRGREPGSQNRTKRRQTLHRNFDAIEVGRQTSGVGQDNSAFGLDTHRKAGCVATVSTQRTAVEGVQTAV